MWLLKNLVYIFRWLRSRKTSKNPKCPKDSWVFFNYKFTRLFTKSPQASMSQVGLSKSLCPVFERFQFYKRFQELSPSIKLKDCEITYINSVPILKCFSTNTQMFLLEARKYFMENFSIREHHVNGLKLEKDTEDQSLLG